MSLKVKDEIFDAIEQAENSQLTQEKDSLDMKVPEETASNY